MIALTSVESGVTEMLLNAPEVVVTVGVVPISIVS